jgi:hypothetical protein
LGAVSPRATPLGQSSVPSPTRLSPGGRHPLQHYDARMPVPASGWRSTTLWALLAHRGRRTGTAGGRSAPGRLVHNPSRRYASHDAGQGRRRRGNLRLRSLVITLRHPDGVPERLMREALDCPVDRLASGWATHAVRLADEGGSSIAPSSWPLAPAWNTPGHGRTVAARHAAIPGVRAMGLVCIAHRETVTAAAGVEGWAEPGRRPTLACVVPQRRRARAASSPPASTCW